jgi:hypothetical protein
MLLWLLLLLVCIRAVSVINPLPLNAVRKQIEK